MAQTREGAIKIAARNCGISVDEYQLRIDAGLKRCTKCKAWKPRDIFCKDASRSDGLKTACKECDQVKKESGPTKLQRDIMRAKGFEWCRSCKSWLVGFTVRSGLCRPCAAAYERSRYAKDTKYRAERRQHAHSRKRGVAPVPAEYHEQLRDNFDGHCAYCMEPATTWDHITPVSQGGRTTPGNIVPACVSCNSSKGDRDVFDWMETRNVPDVLAVVEHFSLEQFIGN